MRTDELDYPLPRELIATHPASPRDSARLMVVRRSDPTFIEHRIVRDLPELLDANDRVVFNTTRVLPARLLGSITQTGGKAEALYLHDEHEDDAIGEAEHDLVWRAMVRTKRARPGRSIELYGRDNQPTGVVMTLIERVSDDSGEWRVGVDLPIELAGVSSPTVLARVGRTPLPPYILGARTEARDPGDDEADQEDYQTVFASDARGSSTSSEVRTLGSVAAPTAGLHMTPELLAVLHERGVARSDVTLHVGAGTFKPVETEHLEDHPMHAEWCSLGETGHAALAPDSGRVIAVGTTSARTLESFAALPADQRPDWLETRLLIAPGYEWRAIDGLLTNFHLPRSTLLAMVGALFPDGVERVKALYAEAIEREYRFFSFGDAMLILP